jgi:hypothetical protein
MNCLLCAHRLVHGGKTPVEVYARSIDKAKMRAISLRFLGSTGGLPVLSRPSGPASPAVLPPQSAACGLPLLEDYFPINGGATRGPIAGILRGRRDGSQHPEIIGYRQDNRSTRMGSGSPSLPRVMSRARAVVAPA